MLKSISMSVLSISPQAGYYMVLSERSGCHLGRSVCVIAPKVFAGGRPALLVQAMYVAMSL